MARWIDDKRKRDEEEAQRQQAEQDAARAQRAQEQKAAAEARAHKAAQESLRPASEQKVKTAPLVVNLDKQTNQSAARVASRMPDETERDGFLNEYISHVKKQTSPNYQKYAPTIGTMRELTDKQATGGVYEDTRAKYDKQRQEQLDVQKNGQAAMQALSGLSLTGFDGQTINVNTAEAATVIRGINSIADDDTRAKAAKAFKTLTETPGSRFYGESTDGVGEFLESANLTADSYKEETKRYAGLFYGDGKHDQEDASAYLEERQAIEANEDYSDYAKGQLVAALDKAYNRITGGETPSVSSADTSSGENGKERTTEEEQEDEKKPGFISGLFGQTPKAQEAAQTEQLVPVKEVQGPAQQKSAESGAAMQAQFGGKENGGNVDLTKRPQVDYETMKAAGWGDYTEPGGVSTVLTTGYGAPEDGFMAQLTPIREDGSVLSPDELDAYYDSVAEAVQDGKSITEADPEHLVLASKQGTPKELESQREWLDNYGEELHQAQAAYYEPESESETPEVQGPIQMREMTPEEKIIASGGMSFDEWMNHPSVAAATSPLERGDLGEVNGKEEAQTIGEAAGALLSGRYDEIEGAGKDELDRMLEGSAYARRMIGTLTEEDSQRVRVGNDMAEAVTYTSIASQGQTIRTLYDAMNSDSFPAELRGDVLAQMIAWASQAEKMEQQGTLGGDAELPLMERLLTTDEHAMDELQSIYAARDELLTDKAEMRREQEEQSAQALSDARTAALHGTASEEQLALVRANAEVSDAAVYNDNGYWLRQTDIGAYFAPGADGQSAFAQSSVKLSLDAQGVIDTSDYEAALYEQMGALLEEDTRTAIALGLTLEDYYAKTGGVDMNALCERAASRMNRQGASITEEEMTALEAPYGQGVGAPYLVGAGMRAGGEQWYLDFKDSLYVGYSQGMVTRNAARLQDRYQSEYGAYGRTQYRKDIEAALASGTLDENYAAALQKALASAADPYQLGIDPRDFEGNFLKNSAAMRRDIATMEGYMRQNATEDEFKWFGRVKSMTYNTISAGVAAGTTLLTGSNLVGFNTGYSVVGFKNNFDEYLQKGYSINSAKHLAAVNTGLDCAVNIGTFDAALGRLTGMSALTEAARNQIIRNPAGACKGLAAIRAFGQAFAQNEFDEVVHDEFFEGVAANWTDNALGEFFRRLDAGEDISFTDGLKMTLNLINPKNLDLTGAAEGVVSGAVENAIGAVMFSLSSAAGAGAGTFKGVKAAQDLMSGKRTDVKNVIRDVTQTLGDEQACALLDDYAAKQKESKAVAEEIVSGQDESGSLDEARHAQADAERHEGKAQEAEKTMEAAAQIIEEKQTAIENGEGGEPEAQELSEAAMAYAKAKQDYAEQAALAEHRREDADTAIDKRMEDARQAAHKAVTAEDAAAREAILSDRTARTQAIDSELAELNRQDEALQTEFTEALSSLNDAQEMGLDEDTLSELMARTDAIAERMAALEEQREQISDPEAYAARQQVADGQAEQIAQTTEAAAQATQPEQMTETAAQEKQTERASQTAQTEQSAAQAEETAQTAGSQYSVGEIGREAGQGGVDAGGLKNPVFQKFASVIYRNHGTEIVVANLTDGVRSAYDPRTNRLYISSKLGTGTAMREALVHELMHSVEGSSSYNAYKEAAMQAAYHGNEADMRHDVQRIREAYGAVYEREGRTMTEADVQKELVTRATEKVIEQLAAWTKTGGETQIYDLLGEKQRFGVRLYNRLTQFIARQKAKKNGTLEAYNELVRARDALKEALTGAKGRQNTQTDGGTEYALRMGENGKPVVTVEEDILQGVPQKDWAKTVKQTLKEKFPNGVTVGNNQIQITGKSRNEITNSKDTMWLKRNQSDVYADKMRAANNADEILQASTDYVSQGLMHERKDNFVDFSHGNVQIEVGGQMYDADVVVGTKDDGSMTLYDFVRMTKKETQRTAGHQSAPHDIRAASLSNTSIAQDATAVNPYDMQSPTEYAIDLNQFGGERARAVDSLYDEIRKDLSSDAGINRRQVEEANRQYETRGAEDIIAELSTKDMWTAEEIAQAAVIRKRAENDGHLMQAAMMDQMYRERAARAGAALQAGSLYKRLTTSGAMAESLDRANGINRRMGLGDGMIPMGDSAPVLEWRAQQQKAETSLQYALLTDEQKQTMEDYQRIIFKKVPEKVYDLYEAAYATQKAAEKKLHVSEISRDNPWGLPIESWKMELIDRYKLRGTKLPGYDYFKASRKERMLAAILATRNNERGHGLLTLCQQLEFMKAGYAVVTEADLNYITGEMATFQLLEAGNEEPQTPEGKTAIQRIYSAQANAKPNSLWGKWNNYGYDSMLSSPKTWNKNVMSNILTRPLELASEGIASIADKQIAKKTGNRTTAMPSREGMRAGNTAFAEEIANTLTDYLIRGTDTGHGSSFDFNNNRRTYDNAFMQTYHDFIAMAMQLGDRPFWEQCYAEEMRVLEDLNTKVEELRRTEGGNEEIVLRKMNQKEREEEAARRATERVFQEDNVLINGLNYVRNHSRLADVAITTLMPFLKTPTNVAIRAMQYSPLGLAYTVVKNGLIDAKTNNGMGFDQRTFVMNLGRGLTGTGLMIAGMALANAGFIKPGREDEDNSRISAIQKSEGKSYGMYFDLFGVQIPVDFAFPAVSPMIIGAEVAQTIREHEGSDDGTALALNVTKAMAAASLDQLCDNSMLQGVSSIFRGYKDNAQIVTAVLEGMAENTASRLTPASIRAVAKFTDPYVRDTKSQNGIRELLNAQIIQNWPILRQTLPKAQTLTGEDMLQTGANSWGKESQNAALHFLNSFITPWTAGSETRDEKLDELVELAYATGETSFLPGALVNGNKYTVTIGKTLAKELKIGRVGLNQYESVTLHLTDEEKRWANSAYADALWNGSGRDVTGLRKLMDSRKWQRMSDEEKMSAVKEEAGKAKKMVLTEVVRRKKEASEIK